MPAHHSLASLIARAAEWEAQDPDPETRAELSALVSSATDGDAAAVTALASAFDGTLQFGTAGLRAALGPGSNRMNRVVVARTAAGLATYLLARGESSVVIGYDARSKSEAFARDVAEILAGAGLEALLLPSALPTPVLVFALRHLGCAAAVMVTASHNPATDNGLKVYVDGAPIIPPVDADIAACIDAVASVPDLPRSTDYRVLDDEVLAAYVRHAVSLLGDGPRAVRAVYTPMHGVGGTVFEQAVTAAGFPAPQRVAAQFDPDGTFPTAPFPNPEEPGAMDLALEQASQSEVGGSCSVAVHQAWGPVSSRRRSSPARCSRRSPTRRAIGLSGRSPASSGSRAFPGSSTAMRRPWAIASIRPRSPTRTGSRPRSSSSSWLRI